MTDSQKTKRAIGLKYDGGDKKNAPKVVAKGYGDLAEAIIAMAEETERPQQNTKGHNDTQRVFFCFSPDRNKYSKVPKIRTAFLE